MATWDGLPSHGHPMPLSHVAMNWAPWSSLSPATLSAYTVLSDLQLKPEDGWTRHDEKDTSNKENQAIPEFDHLPITSPVPLLCAAIGKAAIQSILSAGQEDDEEIQAHISNDFNQNIPHSSIRLEIPASKSFESPKPMSYDRYTTHMPHQHSIHNQKSTFIVRPLSPSTLMALTEPCLMAWCYTLQEDDPCFASAFTAHEQQIPNNVAEVDPACTHNHVNMISNTRNMWGY